MIESMLGYMFTDYFENEVLRKRPYLKKEWCIRVCENPLQVEPQEHNRDGLVKTPSRPIKHFEL
jgi:hypothetical protein